MLNWRNHLMSICLVASDMLTLIAVWMTAVLVRFLWGGQFDLLLYWHLAPYLALFVLSNALADLYPGILLSPPEELKKLTQSTSVIFLALSGAVFLSKQAELYSRGIFLMAWTGALAGLPLSRCLLRRLAHNKHWWGYPAVILGAGKTGTAVIEALSRDRRAGLRPKALFDDNAAQYGQRIHGLPVLGPLHQAAQMGKDAVAIIAMPGISPARLVKIIEGPASGFRRLILIPDLFGASSLWISAFDLGGIVGLEVRQKLLDPSRQWIKRCMELFIVVTSLPLLVLLGASIALWVSLDSPGPVLFRHRRIGQHGRDIFIWKFRTMIQNADQALELHLEANPQLKAEWEQNQKLTHDPRLTRVGRLLRRTSLDELPQLWNVLRGDLSLVGPRPIVWAEVDKYQNGFELYKKVKPGLTGLWQISGRSQTTYVERVRLDAYYVRNWSVWFDIYILIKTPLEVFRGRGAY